MHTTHTQCTTKCNFSHSTRHIDACEILYGKNIQSQCTMHNAWYRIWVSCSLGFVSSTTMVCGPTTHWNIGKDNRLSGYHGLSKTIWVDWAVDGWLLRCAYGFGQRNGIRVQRTHSLVALSPWEPLFHIFFFFLCCIILLGSEVWAKSINIVFLLSFSDVLQSRSLYRCCFHRPTNGKKLYHVHIRKKEKKNNEKKKMTGQRLGGSWMWTFRFMQSRRYFSRANKFLFSHL